MESMRQGGGGTLLLCSDGVILGVPQLPLKSQNKIIWGLQSNDLRPDTSHSPSRMLNSPQGKFKKNKMWSPASPPLTPCSTRKEERLGRWTWRRSEPGVENKNYERWALKNAASESWALDSGNLEFKSCLCPLAP